MHIQLVIGAVSAFMIPDVSMIESWVRRLSLEKQWYATLMVNTVVIPLPRDITGIVCSYCQPGSSGVYVHKQLTDVRDRIQSAMDEDAFDIRWYDEWTREYDIAQRRLQESRVLYGQINGILQLALIEVQDTARVRH
jgi:hypothetical protein